MDLISPKIMNEVIPAITPYVASLAVCSFVILFSTNMKGKNKILFQSSIIALATSVAAFFLISHANDKSFHDLWLLYRRLSYEAKFALGILSIGAAYFGGALYVGNIVVQRPPAPESAAILDTPATAAVSKSFPIPDTLPEDDKIFFENMLERFTQEIIQDLSTTYEMPQEAVEWVTRMIKYTVDGGKMNRGLATVSVIRTFAKTKNQTLTNKDRIQAAALGWCIEFLQAFFLVADDVMDSSVTRRGNPCWYRLPEVKLISINDSFILESCVYIILKRYFRNETYYPQLVDLFLETTRQTELGQLLDLTSQPQTGPIDLNRFTIERYNSIVKYKTAFYSFYLPVALGMIKAGITDVNLYNKARKILCIMGEYFQIQDDYLDCYGLPEVIGKVGTDIQDNKCSWLVVQALNMVNSKQKTILFENYGQHNDENIQKIKELYKELKLEDKFNAYEEESYKTLRKLIDDCPELPKEVFDFLLNKIYKRSK